MPIRGHLLICSYEYLDFQVISSTFWTPVSSVTPNSENHPAVHVLPGYQAEAEELPRVVILGPRAKQGLVPGSEFFRPT